MKILYIITKSNWGGAQRHVYDLAVAAKTQGETVIVALGGNGILRQKLEDIGIKTYVINKLGRDIAITKDAGSFREIFSVIRHEKPDVMHLHSPKAAGLGAIAGRLLRVKKIIYTVHGWTWNEDRPIYQKLLIALVSWFTMILVHKVILLSEYERKQAEHFPWVKNKLSVIPVGIKTPIFMSVEGTKQTLAKHIGMDLTEFKKKIVVGTIAELHPNKGLEYLIEAMKDVVSSNSGVISIIIGDGDISADLHMQIKSAGLEGRIFLAGYMADASQYLKAFSVFVLPSLKEGLPYAILEAGSASLPVISTTVGGIPEMIDDMKSGVLVQPKDSGELAHAISYMIEHPLLARQYGSTLRENVIQKFSLEKTLGKVISLYS
ncbi:MAG: glycosyltransferase family 4 protein [Candidatus Taylorbacteria bacterium]